MYVRVVVEIAAPGYTGDRNKGGKVKETTKHYLWHVHPCFDVRTVYSKRAKYADTSRD